MQFFYCALTLASFNNYDALSFTCLYKKMHHVYVCAAVFVKGKTTLTSVRRDGTTVLIDIKHTCVVQLNSPTALQFYNVVFKTILGAIGYKLIGRNYFNPKVGVTVPKHRFVTVDVALSNSVVYF